MRAKSSVAIVAIIAVAIAILMLSLSSQSTNRDAGKVNASTAIDLAKENSLTIVTISGGVLIPNSTYLLSPLTPSNAAGNITIRDGDSADSNPSPGIITVNGLASGNYSVVQLKVPPQYPLETQPRIVNLGGSQGTTVTFNNPSATNNQQSNTSIKSLVYTSKFECGTISGSEGPLRPGHYDTDISIFNKQDIAVKIFISASVTNGRSSNSILQTIEAHSASSIVCKDLDQLFGTKSQFTEGFVTIEAPRDPQTLGELSYNGAVVVGQQSDQTDLLDVQVFYTANALDTLPHSVYADKISFTILNDSSGKIPAGLMKKQLDVTVSSDLGKISDPEAQVKQLLADKYALSSSDLDLVKIRIDGVGVGVGTMVDDHAISLTHITPQLGN